METAQYLLLGLLALIVAVAGLLLIRTARGRIERARLERTLLEAAPRISERMAMFFEVASAEQGPSPDLAERLPAPSAVVLAEAAEAGASTTPTPAEAAAMGELAAVVEAPTPVEGVPPPVPAAPAIDVLPGPTGAPVRAAPVPARLVRQAPRWRALSEPLSFDPRRRIWRDASGAIVALSIVGLAAALAFPTHAGTPLATETPLLAIETGQPLEPTPPVTEAPPTPIEAAPTISIEIPSDPPTVRVTPEPTRRPGQPQPTHAPTPKPTPKPTPAPTATPTPPPPPPPIADFTCSLVGDLRIAFTSTSTRAETWSWNFGDPDSGSDNTSSLASPSHTFTFAGNYPVRLTVTNSGGSDFVTHRVDADTGGGC